MHDVRSGPHAKVNVLARHGAVDDARYDDGREGDAESDLADKRGCGTEGGRGDERTGEVVYDGGHDKIECDCEDLHKEESLGEVARIFHFCRKGEEGDMTSCTWVSRDSREARAGELHTKS